MDGSLVALQARLQHTFSDQRLLQLALTHRSFSADHNERLEFLGDSVLNLAVSHLLYIRLSALPEGDLSRVRANLVKQDTLHRLAVGLALSPLLKLGEGEARSGGPNRPSILADALEALIGAVYLDAGFAAAQALVHRLYEAVEINPRMEAAGVPRGRHTGRGAQADFRCRVRSARVGSSRTRHRRLAPRRRAGCRGRHVDPAQGTRRRVKSQ